MTREEILDEQIDDLLYIIEHSNNIVALTGAGISVPSGIPDFRSDTGLYATKYYGAQSGEYLLSHECLMREPETFYKFYKDKIVHRGAEPNAAHKFLAHLEAIGKLKAIITQNIDGLHIAAGSKNVIEFHGTTYENHCMICGKRYSLDDIMAMDEEVPHCKACGSMIRPDVILYGEQLDLDIIEDSKMAIRQADTLLVIGTSLRVYPAAGLIDYYHGHRLVLINKDATSYDREARLCINDDVVDVVERLYKKKHGESK